MFLTVGIVASLGLAGAPAFAQSTEEPPGTESSPDIETLPAPNSESDQPATADPETTRAEHLDQLFELLANSGAENWEPIASQIWAAWNHSGSASMDLLARRADQAMEKQDFDTALLHLNDLTRLAPEFAEGWNKRATLHFSRGEYGDSLEDIAQTLKREPRHFGALSGLGIILDRIGDKEGALEAYRRAVKIHPNLPGAADGIKKLAKEVEGQRL